MVILFNASIHVATAGEVELRFTSVSLTRGPNPIVGIGVYNWDIRCYVGDVVFASRPGPLEHIEVSSPPASGLYAGTFAGLGRGGRPHRRLYWYAAATVLSNNQDVSLLALAGPNGVDYTTWFATVVATYCTGEAARTNGDALSSGVLSLSPRDRRVALPVLAEIAALSFSRKSPIDRLPEVFDQCVAGDCSALFGDLVPKGRDQ